MNKQEFMQELRERLRGLPRRDVEERLDFYSEMIDDRIEEGLSEEQAIREMGSLDKIAEEIAADIPLSKLAKEKISPKRRLAAWEIVLIALGSPIWIVLLISAAIVVISLYAVLWSLVVSFWAVFGALAGCAVGGVAGGIFFAAGGHALSGFAIISAGLVCAGLSILAFIGSMAATKGIARLTKLITVGIKKLFVNKEDAL